MKIKSTKSQHSNLDSPYKTCFKSPAIQAFKEIPQDIDKYTYDEDDDFLCFEHDKLLVKIKALNHPITESAQRLLTFIQQKYTEQCNNNSTLVKIIFDEYAECRSCINEKARVRLRKEIVENIKILSATIFKWRGKLPDIPLDCSLIISQSPKWQSKQVFYIELHPMYASYLRTKTYLMHHDSRTLSLDIRHPALRKFAEKLIYHWELNKINHNQTYDIISLDALLNAAPDLDNFKTLAAKGERHYKERIIEHVDNLLEKLRDANILKEFIWLDKNNNPVTIDEIWKMKKADIEECKIRFVLLHDPCCF